MELFVEYSVHTVYSWGWWWVREDRGTFWVIFSEISVFGILELYIFWFLYREKESAQCSSTPVLLSICCVVYNGIRNVNAVMLTPFKLNFGWGLVEFIWEHGTINTIPTEIRETGNNAIPILCASFVICVWKCVFYNDTAGMARASTQLRSAIDFYQFNQERARQWSPCHYFHYCFSLWVWLPNLAKITLTECGER